jgi:hypothetical protein
MKPIPTVYGSVQFRSRLEAKWAAFFDAMGGPHRPYIGMGTGEDYTEAEGRPINGFCGYKKMDAAWLAAGNAVQWRGPGTAQPK